MDPESANPLGTLAQPPDDPEVGSPFQATLHQGETRPRAVTVGLPNVPGYEVLKEVGRGGMGVVYKARDVKLNRVVALKMVLHGNVAGPAALVRFLAEAEALAALQHPNVVQVYDRGQFEGLPYFTMEYCPGGSLVNRVARGPMPAGQAAGIVAYLAHGVAAAHAHGILHRDLKPENVLFGADGVPKLTDFGLAKRFDSDVANGPGSGLTQTGAVLGTPSYMAPEQARADHKAVGPAADVWSLGAVLYMLVTGRPPFLGATSAETTRQVIDDEPVAPWVLTPGLPKDLSTICLKCLQKDSARRYASAEALAEDLLRFADGRSINARPVSRPERAAKWAKRNKALAASFAGVTLSLALGTTVSLIKYRDAKASEEQARVSAEVAKANEQLARSSLARAETGESAAKTATLEAQQQAARAKSEAAKSDAVSKFLAGLFEAPDPIQLRGATAIVPRLRGEQLTALEMLKRGAESVPNQKLPEDVKAHLLDQIGGTCISIGDLKLAAKALGEARRIREALHGPDDPGLAQTFQNLGWIEYTRGDYVASREYLERAIRLQSAKPVTPETEYDLSAIRIQFAVLLAELEEFGDARKEADTALAIRRRLRAANDPRCREPQLAETLVGSAIIALMGQDLFRGAAHAQEAIDLFRASRKDDPVVRAVFLLQDGVVLGMRGQNDVAIQKLTEARDLAIEQLKLNNVYTALMVGQLAVAQRQANRHTDAAASYQTCFGIMKELKLLTHPKLALVVQGMAFSMISAKQSKTALERIEEWLAAHQEANPTSLPRADALTVAAGVYGSTENRVKERQLLDEAAKIYRSQPKLLKRRMYVINQAELGGLHLRDERWVEAEGALKESLDRIREWYPNEKFDPDTIWILAAYAKTQFARSQFSASLEQQLMVARDAVTQTDRDPRRAREDRTGKVLLECRLSEYFRGAKNPAQAINFARSAADTAVSSDTRLAAAEQLAACGAIAPDADREAIYKQAVALLGRLGAADPAKLRANAAFKPLVGRPDFEAAVDRYLKD